LAELEVEESRLPNEEKDIFTNGVGIFYKFHETRPYMKTRFTYFQALQQLDTHKSTKLQLETLLDMLRLSCGDNMGVRDIVPGLMLRLNKDQECYDFIKWWMTKGQESNYAFGDTSLPYLNLKNEDACEEPEFFSLRSIHLLFAVHLTILKMKLLLDV
jgi:hypothetical protein